MPSVSIKLIVAVQWMLVIWASIWAPSTYVLCNITTLAVGVWALADRQSVDAVFMFNVMLVLSIIVDIVMLSLYFPSKHAEGETKFGVGMAIVNLILKPFAILLLYQMYKDRGGEYNINFGPNNTTSYDHIGGDENAQTEPDHGSTAYLNPPIIHKSAAG